MREELVGYKRRRALLRAGPLPSGSRGVKQKKEEGAAAHDRDLQDEPRKPAKWDLRGARSIKEDRLAGSPQQQKREIRGDRPQHQRVKRLICGPDRSNKETKICGQQPRQRSKTSRLRVARSNKEARSARRSPSRESSEDRLADSPQQQRRRGCTCTSLRLSRRSRGKQLRTCPRPASYRALSTE